MMNHETVKTWKVQVTAAGVMLTINGKAFELGSSADAIVFDLERAAAGYTVPDRKEVAPPAPCGCVSDPHDTTRGYLCGDHLLTIGQAR